jgi:hypothetical protein
MKSTDKSATRKSSKNEEESKRKSASKSKSGTKRRSKYLSKLEKDVANLSKRKSRKSEKDPTRPKKANTAYIQYTTEQIPLLKTLPQYKGAGEKHGFKILEGGVEMKHTDFMTVAATNWNGLSDKERAKYDKLAEEDK